MNVYVNRTPVELPGDTTVSELLERQRIAADGTAVAVNNRVVPRSEWAATPLHEEDRITIIRAVCGG